MLFFTVPSIALVGCAFYDLMWLNVPSPYIHPVLDLLRACVAWVGWPLVFTNVLWLGYAVCRWRADQRRADAPLPPVDGERPPSFAVGDASDQVQDARPPG